jgi:hypothetical protein
LGYGFVSTYRKGEKGKYQLVVEDKRWITLKAKLKEITRKTKPMSFDQRMQKLKEVHRGWINYFKFASIYNKLNETSMVRTPQKCMYIFSMRVPYLADLNEKS